MFIDSKNIEIIEDGRRLSKKILRSGASVKNRDNFSFSADIVLPSKTKGRSYFSRCNNFVVSFLESQSALIPPSLKACIIQSRFKAIKTRVLSNTMSNMSSSRKGLRKIGSPVGLYKPSL